MLRKVTLLNSLGRKVVFKKKQPKVSIIVTFAPASCETTNTQLFQALECT